jgi:hypothetical protein
MTSRSNFSLQTYAVTIVRFSSSFLFLVVQFTFGWSRHNSNKFQTSARFPAVKPGLILEEAEKSTHLMELDVRKPLVGSIPQTNEELRLYNLV